MEAINDSLKNIAKALELLKACEVCDKVETTEIIHLLEKTVDILSTASST